jgi:hypothetical protein
MTSNFERYQPDDRAAWRRWLRANHARVPGIGLVFLKGAERQLSYARTRRKAVKP